MRIFLVAIFGGGDGLQGIAIGEDGVIISGHYSSNEDWLREDLVREFHLARYAEHCPGGYVLEYVPVAQAAVHEGLLAALALSKGLAALERPCIDVSAAKGGG